MNLRSGWFFLLALVFFVAGLAIRSRYSANFNENLAGDVSSALARALDGMDEEADQFLKPGLSDSSEFWNSAKNFFLHIEGNRVLAWSRNEYFPDIQSLHEAGDISCVFSARGEFIVKNWSLPNGTSLVGILRLTDRYPIINSFLSPQWNSSLIRVSNARILPSSEVQGYPVIVKGKTLFKLFPETQDQHESFISFLLMGLAFVLSGIAIVKVKIFIEERYGFDLSFAFLFVSLILMRISMIAVSFPSSFFPVDVFDARTFASSSLNGSIGELFLNAVTLLLLVIYLFQNFKKFKTTEWIFQLTGARRHVVGVLSLLLCFLALLFPYDFIEAIYHNSALSLDIAQSVAFSGVRIVAVASVLTACFTSFLFINVFFFLANHLFGKQNIFFLIALVVASLLFAAEFYLTGRILWTTLALGLFYFTVLKLSALSGMFRVSFQLFIYLIFSLTVFSIQNSVAVRHFQNERQVRDQIRFGKDFLTERDVLGEYLLEQASKRIAADQFIQTRMASPFLSKSVIADKIRRAHLNNYFDRYEISILTKTEEQKLEDEFDGRDSLNVLPLNTFVPTGYAGISYAKTSDGNTVKRYRVQIPIYFQRPVGFVELDLSLKRIVPENVYPELLVDNRFSQIYRNRDFSYAVFSKGKVISASGPFNYQRDFGTNTLTNPDLFSDGLTISGYYHVATEDTDGTIAVVSASTYAPFYFITNVSFWFVLGLAVLIIGQTIIGVNLWLHGEQINYSSRIQLFIFLAFLLPVLAVSITTLTLIGRASEEKITDDYVERSGFVGRRMADLLATDSVAINSQILEGWIEENAASSKIDITVYSPDGSLLATSQPALFEDQLVSPLIDRDAWKKIVVDHDATAVTNEQIGKLQYSCAYSEVRSPATGELFAIVGLPFFESAISLERSQSAIFANILIVFVVVFLLFSVLAFGASRSLTSPIRFIAKMLGQTTLTGQNKPMEWKSSDEIGALIGEYNRMLENLQASRRALAQTEKELAWREMAKQVAHEIKNPLTPMKLTLQQMEQALNAGDLPVAKSRKSVDVLLKQVDILNQIATSFSSFASMPAQILQRCNLGDLLQSVVNFFGATENANISLTLSENPVYALVDPESFNRAVSNIIINAVQARKENVKLEVNVVVMTEGFSVRILISDNGSGIPASVQEKIFQPHFTTKQSGSGLGLAMTRQIILQAGGKIRFESVAGVGATFIIELPAA